MNAQIWSAWDAVTSHSAASARGGDGDMAPVDTHGLDRAINETGQIVGTVATFALAFIAIVFVVDLCRRRRQIWPAVLLVSGTGACLMEPLFDHLYGLWFLEEGQWNLYTTFGSAQPIWVPAAYCAFYGGASAAIAVYLERNRTMRAVWTCYAAIVAMAIAAEMLYVSVLDLYTYQDDQPFVVAGYPIFLGFTNAMSALVSGIVAQSLIRVLPTWRSQLALITLVPSMFAMGLFGTGILYLSVRHGFEDPPAWLTHLAALTVVAGIASTVRLLGNLLVADGEGEAPAGVPEATSDPIVQSVSRGT